MKSLPLLGVLSLFTLLVVSPNFLIVQAESGEPMIIDYGKKNFYSSNNSGSNILATFHVKAIVETDANGHWTLNRTYDVKFYIFLAHVNESVYDADRFAVECFQPNNPVNDAIMTPSKNDKDTLVTRSRIGGVFMTLRPQSAGDTIFNFDFAQRVYYNHSLVTSGSWAWDMNNNSQPFSITVDSDQQPPFSTPVTPELTPSIFVVGLLAVLIAVLVVKRTFEKKT